MRELQMFWKKTIVQGRRGVYCVGLYFSVVATKQVAESHLVISVFNQVNGWIKKRDQK